MNTIIEKRLHLYTFSVYTNVYGFFFAKDQSFILDTFGVGVSGECVFAAIKLRILFFW